MHMLRSMGQQVALLVNGAALDRQVVTPERHERGFEPGCPINDHELGALKPSGVEVFKKLAPRCSALATRSAGKQRPTLFSDPPYS